MLFRSSQRRKGPSSDAVGKNNSSSGMTSARTLASELRGAIRNVMTGGNTSGQGHTSASSSGASGQPATGGVTAQRPNSQPSPGHTAIDIGFVDRWQSIDNAAFRPTALNREALIREVYTFVGSGDHGGLYEWLKRVVLSCRFIQSGGDLTNIAIATMAMVLKIVEPEEVCFATPSATKDVYLKAVK